MDWLEFIYSKYSNRKPIYIFIFLFLLGYAFSLIAFLTSYIDASANLYDNSIMEKKIDLGLFLLLVTIGPILETFIFQYIIYEWIYKKLLNNRFKKWMMMSSAVLFAIAHNYNNMYVFAAYFIGFYFIICYDFYTYTGKNAFYYVTLLHAIRNFVSLSVGLLIGDYLK